MLCHFRAADGCPQAIARVLSVLQSASSWPQQCGHLSFQEGGGHTLPAFTADQRPRTVVHGRAAALPLTPVLLLNRWDRSGPLWEDPLGGATGAGARLRPLHARALRSSARRRRSDGGVMTGYGDGVCRPAYPCGTQVPLHLGTPAAAQHRLHVPLALHRRWRRCRNRALPPGFWKSNRPVGGAPMARRGVPSGCTAGPRLDPPRGGSRQPTKGGPLGWLGWSHPEVGPQG